MSTQTIRTVGSEAKGASLQFHRYANLFALMEGEEKATLRESIRKSGVREPIVLFEDRIRDGRNRYDAARELGISNDDIPRREFNPETEGDPADFVWDMNVNRRHLNEAQRAMAAVEMETLRHGGLRQNQERHGVLETKPATREEIGRRYDVHRGTMQRMAVVRDSGVPELKEIARAGGVSVRTANSIAEMPAEVQKSIIDRTEAAGDRAKALQVETAKVVQRAKIAEIGKANRVLDPEGKTFDVIYADPPWQFDEKITGNAWAIENHYPTMSIKDICALPVARLAAERAILFLWTTDHHLIEAEQQVCPAWGGFRPRARMVWVKDYFGLGRFVRNRHEFLIIATRGDFPAPASDCVPDSVFEHPKGKHSVKPPRYAMIEKMTPGLDRRIELFARSRASGWESWGNEVDDTPTAPMRAPVESEIIVPSRISVEAEAGDPSGAPWQAVGDESGSDVLDPSKGN